MSREHIDHRHIVAFADRTVNLPKDKAQEHREQVGRLCDKLKEYVKENPDFSLRKILLSGSLAKHTALRTINDADVAVYVKSAPEDVGELTQWLAEQLRKAFPNFSADQVTVQKYSVRVSFRESGLDVDVVPVYVEEGEEKDDWGHLVSQEDGSKLRTNITLHKEFIRKRQGNDSNYRQVARLLKWWIKVRKDENSQFRFKSFLAELVLAKLVDDGMKLNDYPEALLGFFDYIVKTNFAEQIIFKDYAAKAGTPGSCHDPIRVFDPVNSKNNVARKYSEHERQVIVDECVDAGDAIEAALLALTKTETLNYWQKVFGSSFSD